LATKSQLDRISFQIDRLASELGTHPELCVIEQRASEEEQTACERHYAVNPRDRLARKTVIVRRFSEPGGPS
jgi:hypothetical protein